MEDREVNKVVCEELCVIKLCVKDVCDKIMCVKDCVCDQVVCATKFQSRRV